MRLERAVRFGAIGAVGITIISLVTGRLIQAAQTNASFGWAQDALVVLAVGIGTWVALIFLFGLVDAFIDEKLAVRSAGSEEKSG